MSEVNDVDDVILNVTVPVYNRFHLTQKTLLALKKQKRTIPFIVTVVDNGSEKELQDRLVEFAKNKIIDRLFLLDRNMGVACAANIGWRSVDSSYFLKLDNDIVIKDSDFIYKLISLHKYVEPLSTFGPALFHEWIASSDYIKETPYCKIAKCSSNLPGGALLIPRGVSHFLGRFNEDYGLYGAEDGDYGLRMNVANFKQYYYEHKNFFDHEGKNDRSDYVMNKMREYKNAIQINGNFGYYHLNAFLYNFCIRSWNVQPRYQEYRIDEFRYEVREREDYAPVKEALERSYRILNLETLKSSKTKKEFDKEGIVIKTLKKIWKKCGLECTVESIVH